MTVYTGDNHPGMSAYIGQVVTVQFRGRLAIFKTVASQHAPGGMAMAPVQEKVGAEAQVAATDCLEHITLLNVQNGFAFFEMRAPDKSVAEFSVAVDLVANIWRPTAPPSSLLTV